MYVILIHDLCLCVCSDIFLDESAGRGGTGGPPSGQAQGSTDGGGGGGGMVVQGRTTINWSNQSQTMPNNSTYVNSMPTANSVGNYMLGNNTAHTMQPNAGYQQKKLDTDINNQYGRQNSFKK